MQTSQSKLPSSTQEVSSIFRYPDGTKIPFYVEPGGIQKRPQLVRSLKVCPVFLFFWLVSLALQKNGGDISADPKLADIILVDPSTSQGRSTLRTWGHEDNIVVLHYSWITRCIQEGRAIMGDEGWGGLVAEDDGLPIEGQDTDDVPVYKSVLAFISIRLCLLIQFVIRSPLPTPRDTPDMHNLPRRPRQPVASSSNLNQTTTAPAPVTPFNSMPPPMPFPQGTQPGMPGMPAITPEQLQAWIPWLQYAALSTAMQTQVPLNNPMLGTMSPVSNSPIAPPSPVRSSPPKRRRTSDFVMDEVVPAAESSTHASKRRHSGNVFEDEDGESLLFYVQIQMHNRKDVVTTIKVRIIVTSPLLLTRFQQKNGGRIVGNTNDADYVVLYTAGHDFKALLKSAIAAGKPAVYSRWVTDCVAKEELLDTAEYEFDQSKANPTRRRKASSVAPVEDEEGRPLAKIKRKRNSLVEEPGPSSQPSQPPRQFKFINPAPPPEPKVGTPKLKLAANIQPPQIVQPRPRPVKAKSKASTPKVPPSPSPPPEEDRTLAGRGFIFTDAEIQFLYDYARVLLARDWKISNSAISTAVYKKVRLEIYVMKGKNN